MACSPSSYEQEAVLRHFGHIEPRWLSGSSQRPASIFVENQLALVGLSFWEGEF